MAEPEEIEHEIEKEREHLAQHLTELQIRVEEATDWHTYVHVPPKRIIVAAVALSACVVLALFMFRK